MRRSIVSLLATIALSISLNHPLSAAGEVLILDYHTFLGNHSSSLDYDPSALADQLDEIRALEWAFLAGDKPVWVDFTDPALDHLAVPRFIVYHWNLDQLMQALAKRLL